MNKLKRRISIDRQKNAHPVILVILYKIQKIVYILKPIKYWIFEADTDIDMWRFKKNILIEDSSFFYFLFIYLDTGFVFDFIYFSNCD